jgi:hypothetical protein
MFVEPASPRALGAAGNADTSAPTHRAWRQPTVFNPKPAVREIEAILSERDAERFRQVAGTAT